MPGALAGLICGSLLGIVVAVMGARALRVLATDGPGWLRGAVEHVGFMRLFLPLALLAHATSTAAGLTMGIVYDATTSGGLLTPFSYGALALTALATATAVLLGGRLRRWVVPIPVAGGALFGLALPLLAG